MAATDPALAQLGAGAFTGGGYGVIPADPAFGAYAGSTLTVDGPLVAPYTLTQPQFDKTIYPINWNVAPLLGLLQAHPMVKMHVPDWTNMYTWTTDRHMPEMCLATGTTPLQGTSLSVAYVDMFQADDCLWCYEAGDAYGIVTGTTGAGGAGVVTVSWFAGCAPTVAITAGMKVYKLGNTQPEFGLPKTSPATSKVQAFNYFQEMWYARAESDRFQNQGWQINGPGGSIPAYEKQKLLKGAMLELEKTHHFGQRSWNAGATAVGGGRGTLNGVYYAPGARRWNYGGALLTQADWEIFIDRGRRHRTEIKGNTIVEMGTAQYARIGTFADTAVRTQPGSKLPFGVTVHKWVAKDGKDDIDLIINPLFDFMARDDLIIMLRLEADAVAYVTNRLYPNFTYQDHVIPMGASFKQYGWKIVSSQMIKDGFGHVNIMWNIGSTTTNLV